MPKRSSKKKSISALTDVAKLVNADSAKNPAAVALGRLGGLKGGKARALKLSKQRRRKIAMDAARARWGKERDVD
jgi:hypothetical protein